ncbi:replication-associated recombination protein A [Mucisphaera calidilacus]|uniref:Replication-associated recombination protein A n=1 Tax=Mucisphaera calidilacus TaxID=2527982 RepID=A0A518BZ82_9BACT|nr:replication-associated recombination protein A [Mucisphaera calidilacus]QDU72274.1 Replication-associated recombination protein A [Mucisphaera calidilacus]
MATPTHDLWATQRAQRRDAAQPLAARMRPRTLDEFVGQDHFLGPGQLLRRLLEADRLSSALFCGPPGTGKTSLATLLAAHTQRRFEQANATTVGVKLVREILERARNHLELHGQRTILFLDEIHRFNRAQQDVLLGDVESGIITLIGATTENPFFAVNAPLVSRSHVFEFQTLTEDNIQTLLQRALDDPERGFGNQPIQLTPEAVEHWAMACDGDARRALTALEVAVRSENVSPDGPALVIDLQLAEQSIQQKAVVYDATGDEHYDTISAFIKSMRGSDPDAAIYWLARMLHAGEDPMFIARRIAILASEDIGNADPQALQIAAAAYDITHRIGMPECQLTLGQAAIYMATAPKSNASAMAIWTAMSDVKNQRTQPVPKHLRDGHYAGAKKLGRSVGYQYAHDDPDGHVAQQYLGVDKTYYTPTNRGHEQRITRFLEWIASRSLPDQPPTADPEPDPPGPQPDTLSTGGAGGVTSPNHGEGER